MVSRPGKSRAEVRLNVPGTESAEFPGTRVCTISGVRIHGVGAIVANEHVSIDYGLIHGCDEVLSRDGSERLDFKFKVVDWRWMVS